MGIGQWLGQLVLHAKKDPAMIARTSLASGLLLDDTMFAPTDLALMDFAEIESAVANTRPVEEGTADAAAAAPAPEQSLIGGGGEGGPDPVETARLSIAALNTVKFEDRDGPATMTFKVTRAGYLADASSAHWAVTGTGPHAANAADFVGGVLPSGTVSFAAGETVKVVSVQIAGDSTFESDEGFAVALSAPSAGTVVTGSSATGVILDDDKCYIGFSGGAPDHDEGGVGNSANGGVTHFAMKVNRVGNTAMGAYARWDVTGSGNFSADGADFLGGVLPSGMVCFAPGETSQYIDVPVVRDTVAENNEWFDVVLSAPSAGAILGGTISEGVRILDDDSSFLSIAADKSVYTEGSGLGTTPVTFTVTRTGDTSGAAKAGWHVHKPLPGQSSTPAAFHADDNDFAGHIMPEGVVSFAPGETAKTIVVNVNRDFSIENDEELFIGLRQINGEIAVDTTGAMTMIATDDIWSTVSIVQSAPGSADVTEGNSGVALKTFSIQRTGDLSRAGHIDWSVKAYPGSAVTGADFANGVLPSGTLNFAAFETFKTVTLAVAGDTVVESDEYFLLQLSAPSTGFRTGHGTILGRIVNDDSGNLIAPPDGDRVDLATIGAGLFAPGPVFLADGGGADADVRKAGEHPMDAFGDLVDAIQGQDPGLDPMLSEFALNDEGFAVLFDPAAPGIGGSMEWLSGVDTKPVLALRDGFA